MGHWENAGVPDDFDGIVRLFPLPNMVLFPHVIQALHIFEPRYREMLSDALESDHLIAMALLSPGWENDLDGSPAIGEVVCIGRIVSHTPTDDGKHNLLLAGVSRARIVEEIDVGTTFRQAKVEIIEDVFPDDDKNGIEGYRKNLLGVFRSVIPHDATGSKAFGELLTRQLPLGVLTDIVAYAVNLPSDKKLSLLSESNVIARYHLLMDLLGGIPDPEGEESSEGDSVMDPFGRSSPFPPPFSDN